MNQSKLDSTIGNELHAMNWSNTRHRADLRQQILTQANQPRRAIRLSRTMLMVLLATLLLSTAGAAAWRYFEPFRLSGSIDGIPTEFTIPVNDRGEASLTFIDADGNEQLLIITQDMVDENGVIRDLRWNMAGKPKGDNNNDP